MSQAAYLPQYPPQQGLSTAAKLGIAAGVLVILYLLFKDKIDAYLAGVSPAGSPGVPSTSNPLMPNVPNTPSTPNIPSTPNTPNTPLQPSRFPTAWTCAGDVDVPLRREDNANNDISCMSENNRDCVWGGCNEKLRYYSLPENSNKLKPLVCGNMHSTAYGETGYTNPLHWCYKGNNLIPK